MAEKSRPVAVITGISGGFGQAFAQIFSKNGFNIIGISRHKPDLTIGHHIAADLTKTDTLPELVTAINRISKRIDILILNAGIGLYDNWENINSHELRELMALNLFSPIILTQQLLPELRKTGGTIITVSSVAAFIPVPNMGAYCASKSALNAFADTLRAEVQSSGIRVMNLMPGRINTGFSSRAYGTMRPPETPFAGSPEKFAKATYRAYRNGKRQLIFPGWYRLIFLLRKTFPQWYDKISQKQWQK